MTLLRRNIGGTVTKEKPQEDPVISMARDIVGREIAFRMEIATRQSRYIQGHESSCKCHHCLVQYEQLKAEVEAEAEDWLDMLLGSPTEADKLKPDWTKKHPPKPKQIKRPYEPPTSP